MQNVMQPSHWQFFLSGRHRRLSRLWQSFFASSGLFFTIILIASPFVFQNITWSILEAVDMDSIQANNLSMTNLKIHGIDKKGEPFFISAENALQKFAEPDAIYFTKPTAETTRNKNGEKIRDNITANAGKFLNDRIILLGDVAIKSSDGSTARANEMEIELK